MTGHTLNADEIAFFANFLTSKDVPEGSLDYTAAHGYLCACAILSDELDSKLCLYRITDETVPFNTDEQKQQLLDIISTLHLYLSRQFYLGEDIDYPMPLKAADKDQTNPLTDWCFGFMEAVGDEEAQWFSSVQDEAQIAELLLPISVLSEPFTEPELLHLTNTPQKKQRLASEIPDCLQQLYLLFRD